MQSQRPVTSAYFMLSIAASVLTGGCGESVQSPSAIQEVVELSPEQELAVLTQKAESGDAEAQTKLGRRYIMGDGVPKDRTKAVEWYKKAAAMGYADAQYELGTTYYYGKDAAKTAEWLQKAAAQGHADAQAFLSMLYRAGEGVPKDMVKALDMAQKSAAQGSTIGQAALGNMYANGMVVERDLVKAAELFQSAAAQGDAFSQNELGVLYWNGLGVTKDLAKAVEWWQKAAEQGNSRAQEELGKAYSNGIGVPKDDVKAAGWWQKAAAQGARDAQLLLAMNYFDGSGVSNDAVLAYTWSNLAASSGSSAAVILRKVSEERLSSAEIAEAQRLSSNWTIGQIITREGSTVGDSPSGSIRTLSKKGTGTLFIVSKSGHAITNNHVVGSCTELRIQGREGIAKLVTDDTVNDLALIQIQGSVADTATIVTDPGKLRQGEEIIAFGFPLNSVLSSGGNLTPGVVSALTGLGNNTNQIQITAPIQPGSSGSPVLNKRGEIVGLVSMKIDDGKMARATGQIGQNINFAISGQTLKSFLDTHKVTYNTGGNFFAREKSTADLADEARKWTMVVECWK